MPRERESPFHELLLSLEPSEEAATGGGGWGLWRWGGGGWEGVGVQLVVEFLYNPRGEEHEVKAEKRLRDRFLFLQRN